MTVLANAAPALAMLAAFALAFGGIAIVRKGSDRRKGVLMLVMAAVLVANVMIWTI